MYSVWFLPMLFQASGDLLRLHCPSSSLTDSAVFCPSFLPFLLPSIVHHFSSHWMSKLGHKLMYKPALTEIGIIKTVQIMYFVPGNSSSAGESIGVLLCRQYVQLWQYQNNGRWARGTVTPQIWSWAYARSRQRDRLKSRFCCVAYVNWFIDWLFFDREDRFLWNINKYLPHCAASHSSRQYCS